MPVRGWLPVMVPGAPSAWADDRKIRLPNFERIWSRLSAGAKEGYPVTPVIIAGLWNAAFELFGKIRREEQDTDWLEPWFHHFALKAMPEGR